MVSSLSSYSSTMLAPLSAISVGAGFVRSGAFGPASTLVVDGIGAGDDKGGRVGRSGQGGNPIPHHFPPFALSLRYLAWLSLLRWLEEPL